MWVLTLLFAPVLLILYVAYLIIEATIIIFGAFIYFLAGSGEELQIGRLDPVTDKVEWL